MAAATNQQMVLLWGGSEGHEKEPAVAGGLDGFHVKQIACTVGNEYARAYILTEDGKVFQWGPCSRWDSVPHKSRQISSRSLFEKPVIQIASGFNHFAAVTAEGDLYTWGRGACGRLGHGDRQSIGCPKLVEALAGIHIVQVACFANSTVARSGDGNVYTFGSNSKGCNGNGSTNGNQLLPMQIEGLPTIQAITACNSHGAALCDQGQVYTWGCGVEGQLGHADQRNQCTPKKVEALGQEHIAQVSCGVSHTAALSSSGRVYTFGWDGGNGTLGHNGNDLPSPTLVESLNDTVISHISCGKHHTCFLSDAEELYISGNAKYSSLENRFAPRKVLGQFLVKHVSSSYLQTIVLATRKPMAPDALPLAVSMRNMVNNEACSDIAFQVGNDKVFANKMLLVQRSEYFQTMINSGMRESSGQTIPLAGINKDTLLLVLEYLYTGRVAVPLGAVVDLYMAAEMYLLDCLKQLCKESLLQCLSTDNAAWMLAKTWEAGAGELKDVCYKFVVKNYKAVLKTDGMSEVANDAGLMLAVVREGTNFDTQLEE